MSCDPAGRGGQGDERVIRAHAMGRFADLLAASAHAGTMLYYLDNERSDASRPDGINENYGRELLELHTLGIEPDGSPVYTEADVRGAALIMSGWGIGRYPDANEFNFVFFGNRHSAEAVSLLGGQWTRPAQKGKHFGDSMLLFLARHPSTARNIARRIITRFVTDDPPESLVASAASVYLERHRHRAGAAPRAHLERVRPSPRGQAATPLRVPGRRPSGARGQRARRPAHPYALTAQDLPGAMIYDLGRLVGDASTMAVLFDRLARRFGVGVTPVLRDQLITLVGHQPGDNPAMSLHGAREELVA
jgi:hypothetical protein